MAVSKAPALRNNLGAPDWHLRAQALLDRGYALLDHLSPTGALLTEGQINEVFRLVEGAAQPSGTFDEAGRPRSSFPEREEYDRLVPPFNGSQLQREAWDRIALAENTIYPQEIRDIAQNSESRTIAYNFFKLSLDENKRSLESALQGMGDSESNRKRFWDLTWSQDPSYVRMGRLNMQPPLADLVDLLEFAIAPEPHPLPELESSLPPTVVTYIEEAFRAHIFTIALAEIRSQTAHVPSNRNH